jgi:hypothetical protein
MKNPGWRTASAATGVAPDHSGKKQSLQTIAQSAHHANEAATERRLPLPFGRRRSIAASHLQRYRKGAMRPTSSTRRARLAMPAFSDSAEEAGALIAAVFLAGGPPR